MIFFAGRKIGLLGKNTLGAKKMENVGFQELRILVGNLALWTIRSEVPDRISEGLAHRNSHKSTTVARIIVVVIIAVINNSNNNNNDPREQAKKSNLTP